MPAGAVSAEMDIPYRFVRKIAGRLVRAGLVRGLRGRAGGLRLARRPAAISLLDVLAAVDASSVTLNICLLDPRACRRAGLCEIHPHFAAMQGELERRLAAVSFAQLASPGMR
jgi:Rrf2 family protein